MKKSKQSKKGLKNLKAKTKIAIKFYGRLIGGYAFFFLFVALVGFILDKVIETAFILIGYFMTRFVVPKIKHFNTTQKCISITTATFVFSIAIFCIPKNTSLVWSILVGCTIPLIMYAESLLFDVKITDKEKLINLCKLHNYNELKTEMAIKFFIEKETPKDVWLWLCETKQNPVEWDTMRKIKYRMKKDLFS